MTDHTNSNIYKLDDDFLFGAATSPHQIEGGNTRSDWWAMETAPDSKLSEASGAACDSYHRWREDMRLLSDNGFNAYRFGIEWARIEPEPGIFEQSEIEHYREMIDEAVRLGLRPVVTLYHFSLPLWFAQQGGWTGTGAADRFVDYVRAVLPILRNVAAIVTINEPNMMASMAAYLSGKATMGADGRLPDPDVMATGALIAAHHAAVRLIHAELAGIPVGWSVANQCVQSLPGGELAADRYSYGIEGQFIEAAKGDDFIGIQAYTRTVIGADGNKIAPQPDTLTSNGWEYYPTAAAEALAHTQSLLPAIPMIVTENGISTTDDEQRMAYTHDSLAAVSRLMEQGCPIKGYFYWSLLDNYEWGSWKPTFGLVAVDRQSESFTRVPKTSLSWLGGWARNKALPTNAGKCDE